MEPTDTSLPLPATITDGVIVLDGYVPFDAQTHWESEDGSQVTRVRYVIDVPVSV
jgi:hypothetical protein